MIGSRPEAVRWVSEYTDRCGDEHAVVSFGDTTRVVARYGYGNFNVSYPAELLCTAEDRVSAMRAAIVLVLDRHVRRSRLGLPLLSSIVAAE